MGNKLNKVYIGGPQTVIISDMQGPAPEGFHVPLSTEWQSIFDAGVSLGAWSSSNGSINFSTYLKLPMAGYRDTYTYKYKVGSSGYYWSSTAHSNYYYAYKFLFLADGEAHLNYDHRSNGHTIRCVKNSPVTPTASWTVLYQGVGSAGIFHNPIDGLISISSDGTTWYTIMDKNLGATTVYNYGDTLTNDNCGNVFQWGNNYGFPGTLSSDSITIYNSQVDASDYGPGNYYERSIWRRSTPRDSSVNNNLRGGVSQGTSTKTEYQQIRPKE